MGDRAGEVNVRKGDGRREKGRKGEREKGRREMRLCRDDERKGCAFPGDHPPVLAAPPRPEAEPPEHF